jgi:hypothetical protein
VGFPCLDLVYLTTCSHPLSPGPSRPMSQPDQRRNEGDMVRMCR